MPAPDASRRDFLKAAAAGSTASLLTARSYGQVAGANERIRIGMIGCGLRGHGALMAAVDEHAEAQNLEITAVCDVWSRYRERAVAQVKDRYGRAPFATTAYREVLDRDDVDAVVIATCDFQHARMLEDAARAGKDAYCEKPLAMDFDALTSVRRAVDEAGSVVQIGTQRRSNPTVNGARKLCREGVLGQVNRIEFVRNGSRPNWYKRLVRRPIAADEVDWPQFLMHRPDRPFDDLLFAGWYGFREFCGGSIGQFMSHYTDLVNHLLGSTYPVSAVAHGGTFVWNDEHGFDCRDQVQVSLVYPEGFLLTYATNFGNGSGSRSTIYGSEGIMDLRGRPTVRGAGAHGRSSIEEEREAEAITGPDHVLDWIQCLRSRAQPVAPLAAGHQHSVACILADRALQTGRRQVYDRQNDEIRPG